MSMADAMVVEFTHESAGTRKMLERLPEDRLDWKPHRKSMSLGGLATHIAHIPEWAETIVNDEEFDMSSVANARTVERASRREILEYFETNVEKFKTLLTGKSDEHLFTTWRLTDKGNTVVDMPRVACIRGFVLSHIVHHRGQLSVYLRQNEIPLPALYGPSADEGM